MDLSYEKLSLSTQLKPIKTTTELNQTLRQIIQLGNYDVQKLRNFWFTVNATNKFAQRKRVSKDVKVVTTGNKIKLNMIVCLFM